MDLIATRLIALDWGTSNLRVHLVGAGGTLGSTRRSSAGVLCIAPGKFEQTLREAAGDWLDALPGVPLLGCGMVGSRQGWAEAPYAECPAGVGMLAERLLPVTLSCGRRLTLVPGVACRVDGEVPDVIRGEEVKVIGAAQGIGTSALVCLPGTHAKWAVVEGGALRSFRTAMSGELFQLLLSHSILGRMARADAPFSLDAFRRGVAHAGREGGLLHRLFAARTLRLFDELAADDVASYLSGVLVGDDVCAMGAAASTRPVCVVGEGAPCDAYRHALETLGVVSRSVDGDRAVATGLWRIAGAAGLVS